MKNETFIFESYEFDQATGQILLHYRLDEFTFTEKLTLNMEGVFWDMVHKEALDKALFNLHLIGGISYWKTYCPRNIQIHSGVLTKDQAAFWNKLYEKGLGEFFYKNDIDFRALVHFPYVEKAQEQVPEVILQERSLVPIGGGKDSLVSAYLLEQLDLPYAFMSLNNAVPIQKTAELMGHKRIIVQRTLDPLLFELNEQGVYNGHIPITAYISFLLVVLSLLYDYKFEVLSLEKSANEGQLMFHGLDVNHQYSKSYEFEQDFDQYVKKYIAEGIRYFSLLRPFYELKIAELFSKLLQEKGELKRSFTSCNRNFHIDGKKIEGNWCGVCPKCLFTFIMLAPYLEDEEMLDIFGESLFDNEALLPLFKELLGVEGNKPFECVGVVEEVVVALSMVHQQGRYLDTPLMGYFVSSLLPYTWDMEKMKKEIVHIYDVVHMPVPFQNIIRAL